MTGPAQMQISVIIPAFKPQNYLWECLSSLKAQDLPPEFFEVIIVLNGCREPFEAAINCYVEQELSGISVKLLQTDLPGVSNARNMGIDKARGKYVTFIDDDDVVSPSYLSEMYEIAETGMTPVSFIQAFRDEPEKPFSYYISDNYEQYSGRGCCNIFQLRKFFSISYCKLIPMEIIGARRFDTRFQNGEDSLFMALISDRIDKLLLTSRRAVYFRRLRHGSLIQSQSKKEIVRNGFLLAKEFVSIYFRAPVDYNLFFFVTRAAASFRKVFRALLLP